MWAAVAATAIGPGMPRPDGWPVVNTCQTTRRVRPRSTDMPITRRRSRFIPRPSCPRDGEGLQVLLRLVGIEDARLAQREGVPNRVAVRRLLAERAHGFTASGGQEHLFGDFAIVHVRLQ